MPFDKLRVRQGEDRLSPHAEPVEALPQNFLSPHAEPVEALPQNFLSPHAEPVEALPQNFCQEFYYILPFKCASFLMP
jgi:hypothetical protein